MKKKGLFIAINAVIAVMVAVAYLYMFFRWSNGGNFSSAGLMTLKYFTVLSNLLEGAASLLCVIFYFRGAIPKWLAVLKYASAVSVGLTFFTVMLFLGPVFGYPGMFMGANLAFHLIIPVLSMVEYVLNSDYRVPHLVDSLISVVPMILYGIFYVANILINGVGEGPNNNDWYGFAFMGFPASYLVFVFILAATWLMSYIFLRLKKKLNK